MATTIREAQNAGAAHLVMISGCCGGGKSTLVAELARRGHATVAEPGRRILAEERAGDGRALPWVDAAAFSRRAMAMSIADHEAALGLTFFDRGVVDAAVAARASGGEGSAAIVARYRYDRLFLAPPWPEIYVQDEDRRHSLEKAQSDYERVRRAYLDAGYEPVLLPRVTVRERVDFILAEIVEHLFLNPVDAVPDGPRERAQVDACSNDGAVRRVSPGRTRRDNGRR